jgi:DNA-directed RNA polymerase subunit omega
LENIKDTIIPFNHLVNSQENVYEMTCAAIKRAEQLTMTQSEDLRKKKIKIVSEALREILSSEVQFSYKE